MNSSDEDNDIMTDDEEEIKGEKPENVKLKQEDDKPDDVKVMQEYYNEIRQKVDKSAGSSS